MKTCFKCGETKPLDDFYRHPQMADGHLNKCKECNKEDSRKEHMRKAQDAGWVAQQRIRHRDKYHRLHKTWNHDQEAANAANRRWYRRNQHKKRAHTLLQRTIRNGGIMKPTICQRCGAEPAPRDLHGHHRDYGKPLDVEWICTTCHGVEHWVA